MTILFFDGECNLCNRSVQFVLRYDSAARVHFSPLQSELGQRAQEAVGKDCDSLILLHQGHYSVRSEAALQLCACLDRPWSHLRHLRLLPRRWCDAAYRLVAAHRYRWFGRLEFCLMPTPELRSRFL